MFNLILGGRNEAIYEMEIRPNLKAVKKKEIKLFTSGIRVVVEKNGQPGICPYCGTPSEKVYEYRKQLIFDKPIKNRKVELELNKRRFVCVNENCQVKTFTEKIDGMSKSGRYTQAFEEFLRNLIAREGYRGAQRYLVKKYNLKLSLTSLFYFKYQKK